VVDLKTFDVMVLEPVHCPNCDGIAVIKYGKTAQGKQRYRCQQGECDRATFICDYTYAAYSLDVRQQIGEMAINGSGIRDTARVLGISPTTVIATLKKKSSVASGECGGIGAVATHSNDRSALSGGGCGYGGRSR
jgi:transposase-like protein